MNDMPWIKSYPAGVRGDINITPTPVQKILDDAIAKWPDRPSVEFMGKRMSYRELGDHVNRGARGLQRLGVVAPDKPPAPPPSESWPPRTKKPAAEKQP